MDVLAKIQIACVICVDRDKLLTVGNTLSCGADVETDISIEIFISQPPREQSTPVEMAAGSYCKFGKDCVSLMSAFP